MTHVVGSGRDSFWNKEKYYDLNHPINLICQGMAAKSDVDFFDYAFSNSNESIEVPCCNRDLSLTNVTCGRGQSCVAQCSAIDALLCPSGVCTEDPDDCSLSFPTGTEDEKNQRSDATSGASSLNFCPRYCPVKKHMKCCYHPVCQPKRSLCAGFSVMTGE